MFSFIIDGVVVELFEARPDLHPDMLIVEAGADVREGWRYDGESFSPPPAPPPAPPPVIVVSPRQFRRALLAADLLDEVEKVMADANTPRALKIDWEYATEVRSDYPAWPDMISQIGGTQADLDALFEAASRVV